MYVPMRRKNRALRPVHGLLALAVCTLTVGAAQADEKLAASKNCLACHAVDKKVLGPTYRDIAKRYAGQKGADALLAEKIVKGGKGAWKKELGAEIPMPPNPSVKPDEALTLAKWILKQK